MQKSYQAPMDYGFFTIPEEPALEFALASDNYASPRRFAFGEPINSSALWTYSANENSEFKTTTYPMSPDFGPNTYMGFRSGGGAAGYNYGYLEVTWASATQTFTILGGAYETVPGAEISISTSSAVVPEPVTSTALAGLATLAFVASRRRRAKV
jgi:MYXO-CTERM domain-containing protein